MIQITFEPWLNFIIKWIATSPNEWVLCGLPDLNYNIELLDLPDDYSLKGYFKLFQAVPSPEPDSPDM